MEELYQELLKSLFDKIRQDIENKELTWEQGLDLAQMVQDRLCVDDPDDNPLVPAWQSSDSCLF
jgi:hypothetical protein